VHSTTRESTVKVTDKFRDTWNPNIRGRSSDSSDYL